MPLTVVIVVVCLVSTDYGLVASLKCAFIVSAENITFTLNSFYSILIYEFFVNVLPVARRTERELTQTKKKKKIEVGITRSIIIVFPSEKFVDIYAGSSRPIEKKTEMK